MLAEGFKSDCCFYFGMRGKSDLTFGFMTNIFKKCYKISSIISFTTSTADAIQIFCLYKPFRIFRFQYFNRIRLPKKLFILKIRKL